MNNDTISRSALITELENRMVTAGDPIIKFLFARLIDIVKEQPAVMADTKQDKYQATEYVELLWYSDFPRAEPLLSKVERRIREGWTPFTWAYVAQPGTDHRRIAFRFKREA